MNDIIFFSKQYYTSYTTYCLGVDFFSKSKQLTFNLKYNVDFRSVGTAMQLFYKRFEQYFIVINHN